LTLVVIIGYSATVYGGFTKKKSATQDAGDAEELQESAEAALAATSQRI
jgi:hypothetical protein